jgi:hypothetical protein
MVAGVYYAAPAAREVQDNIARSVVGSESPCARSISEWRSGNDKSDGPAVFGHGPASGHDDADVEQPDIHSKPTIPYTDRIRSSMMLGQQRSTVAHIACP